MKIMQDPAVALLLLVTSTFLGVSTMGMTSSAEECFLKVEVLDINATDSLNRIDAVTVKVVSLDTSETSFYCSYMVGQHILIEEIDNGDITVSDITPESVLKLHFWSYNAMGENGPVAGMTWRILELTRRKEERNDDTTK